MNRLVLPLVFVGAWAAAGLAGAQDNPTSRLSLKGLDAVAVSVGPIGTAAEKDGLFQAQLQGMVETRLRQAGVRLLGPEERLKRLRRPGLSVQVTTARLDTDEHIYSVRVELVQWVASLDEPTLLVTAAIPVPATTWSAPSVLGITPSKTLKRDVEAALGPMVDQFIDAFRKANPRETALRRPR
jgi:hypothetical protein